MNYFCVRKNLNDEKGPDTVFHLFPVAVRFL